MAFHTIYLPDSLGFQWRVGIYIGSLAGSGATKLLSQIRYPTHQPTLLIVKSVSRRIPQTSCCWALAQADHRMRCMCMCLCLHSSMRHSQVCTLFAPAFITYVQTWILRQTDVTYSPTFCLVFPNFHLGQPSDNFVDNDGMGATCWSNQGQW